jgi:hypothetical protein
VRSLWQAAMMMALAPSSKSSNLQPERTGTKVNPLAGIETLPRRSRGQVWLGRATRRGGPPTVGATRKWRKADRNAARKARARRRRR